MSETKPIYSGEAVLLNWHDAKSGRKIVLQLEKYAPGAHPFDGLDGERFGVVIVGPLAPAEHAAPKNVAGSSKGRTSDFDSENGGSTPPPASKPKRRWQDMPASQRAALLVQDASFLEFAKEHHSFSQVSEEPTADKWLKYICRISSKSELNDPMRATVFEGVEKAFRAWEQARGHGVI